MNLFHKHICWVFLATVWLMSVTSCSTSQYGSKYSSSKKRSSGSMAKKSSRPAEKRVYREPLKEEKKNHPAIKTGSLTTRSQIIETAEKYLGSPYKPGGKKPETGFDCSGFTGFIFTQNGYPLSGGSHDIAKMGKQKPKEKLIPGDLVFFGNKERISHVAIVSDVEKGKLEVIHSTTSAGVKKDNILGSEYWESRFLFGMDVIDQSK
jgi:cell wall-associated NlpC family hydrolase